MTGGILQLVAKGVDDIFIIGNAQITYFKCVYRRYSNFSTDQLRLPITSKLQFGKSANCRIKRLADLVHKLYLIIELPDIEIYYKKFTYGLLDQILSSVGISLETIFTVNYGTTFNKNDMVDKNFYDKVVLPTINKTIFQYIEIINFANEQILVLNGLQTTYNPNNLRKYLNPETLPPLPQQTGSELPIIYQLYGGFINSYISVDASYSTIYELYNYLYNLYNNVDNNAINMKNSDNVSDAIYNDILGFKYSTNDGFAGLQPGYTPSYDIITVTPTIELVQSTFIGDNFFVLDTINEIPVVTIANKDMPLLQFFSSKFSNAGFLSQYSNTEFIGSNYANLDFYLTINLYLLNLPQINPSLSSMMSSQLNTNDIITQLSSILNQTLNNNLKQFLQLLNLLIFFTFKARANVSNTANVLMFGYFYQVTPTSLSTITVLKNETDKNIFFYDNDYTNIVPGYFYPNWIKVNVASFFSSVTDIFLGFNGITNYEFVQYFNDVSFMNFLNMDNTQNIPQQLNGILKTSGLVSGGLQVTTPISFDPLIYPGLNQKIALLEFIPFLVIESFSAFFSQSVNGFFNNINISWGTTNFQSMLQSRIDFLNVYTDPSGPGGTGGLVMTANYLFSRTQNILASSNYIVTNLFTPLQMYTQTTIINQLTSLYSPFIEPYLDYLGYMYISTTSNEIATLADVPEFLFHQDALMLLMGGDLICDILLSNITDKPGMIKAIMQIFRLYLLPLDEFPLYGQSLNINLYENIVPGTVSSYVFFELNEIIALNIFNFNYINRLSSIWNIVSKSEAASFDSLFINQLLSTNYYRHYVSLYKNGNIPGTYVDIVQVPSLASTIGIGSTMEQAYEVFVSYYFNKRLGLSTIQPYPLETVLNTTSFFAIEIIDTNFIPFMRQSLTEVQLNFYSNITTIRNNIQQNYLGDFKNEVMVNNEKHYYDTLFNIMSAGLSSIDFKIVNLFNKPNSVVLDNITTITSSVTVDDGFTSLIYKIYPIPYPTINISLFSLQSQLLGQEYREFQIVPTNSSVNPTLAIQIGNTYLSMEQPIPLIQTVNTNVPIFRSTLDFMMHIRRSIETTLDNNSVLYYIKILNYFNIFIEGPLLTLPPYLNITTNSHAIDTILLRYISPNNTPGTLYMPVNTLTTQNPNPLDINNSTIVKKYGSFSTAQNVILFIMDIIIYDISLTNLIFVSIFGSSQKNSPNLNSLISYYNQTINKLTSYLSIMTATDGISYMNSPLYDRLTPLRNTLNGSLQSPKIADFAWSQYIGFNMIDYISIKIGGQLIDKHSGTWLYLDYLLNKQVNQEKGANIMLGNVPELTKYDTTQKGKYMLIIPLRFWFCKYVNTSLPLICLQHSDVELEIKLKDLDKIAYWNKQDTYFKRPLKLKSHILANYICIDSEERNSFATNNHEYLIDTIQRYGAINTGKESVISKLLLDTNVQRDQLESYVSRFQLYFSNMCKEIVWIFKFDDVNSNIKEKNLVLNWNNFAINSPPKDTLEFQIIFNGSYRENWKRASYFNLVQPYNKGYSSLTNNIFLYSFALHPKYLQPSGAVNLDKIYEFSLIVNISPKMANLVMQDNKSLSWDVYCRSTNILRIMSGMAGITFYGSQL